MEREKGHLPRWSDMDDMASEAFRRGSEELEQEQKRDLKKALPLIAGMATGAANDNTK